MNLRAALAVAAIGIAAAGLIDPAIAGDRSVLGANADRPTAAAYVEKAARADLLEIRASEAVLDKLQHLDVRQFARTMIDHHRQSTDMLRRSVRQANTPAPVPPPALDRASAQQVRELGAAPPSRVDQLYLDMQMKAHQEALQLHRYYARFGDDPTLRQAAAERATLVERHLADVERMAANLIASAAK